MLAHWLSQVDAPVSRVVSRELAELQLQLPGEAVESEGKAAMVALMTALPFGVAAGWMLLVAKSSQRMGELLPLPMSNALLYAYGSALLAEGYGYQPDRLLKHCRAHTLLNCES